MIRHIRRTAPAGILFSLVLSAACSSAEHAPSKPAEMPAAKIVLRIGEQQLNLDQLNQFFSSRIGEFADHADLDMIKSRLLEDFLEEQLLDWEAQKLKVSVSEDEVQLYVREIESEKTKEAASTVVSKDLRADIVRTLRVQRYIREYLTKEYVPSQADIQKYYAEHPDEFQVPETVHVKEILVGSAEQAERILDLLKAAQYKNFSQLAKLYSTAPTAASGGEMGLYARGDLPEEMEKVFFSMPRSGRISPIIQTKYGYHIFMLVDRVAASREPFEAAQERIATILREERQKKALAEKVAQLREQLPVVLYRRNLDFGYNGQEFRGGQTK